MVILVVIAIGLGAAVFMKFKNDITFPKLPFSQKQTGSNSPNPTPTPTALMQGKETYSISQASNNTGPKITKAEIDPLDPKIGQKQTITIHSNFSQPLTGVTISVKTDHKVFPLTLSKVSGTDTDGQWQTSWTVEDSVLYTYIMTITAVSGGASSNVDLAIRS